MSPKPCWRCILRASDLSTSIWRLSPARISASAVSTLVKKKKTAVLQRLPARGQRTDFVRTKQIPKAEVRAKRPALGERKAYRKRIVLSNTNALPVYGMEDFSVENMCKQESRGVVLGIPGDTVDQLRAVDAFKPTQAWGMFRRPGMLVRNETVEYAKLLDQLQSQGKSLRRVLVGERGSGKSLMALQAMTMAFLKGWTVINIPEGTHFICFLSQLSLLCRFQLTGFQSPRTHNRSLRLRTSPRQFPSPLHPKDVHGKIPLPNLTRQSSPRKPAALVLHAPFKLSNPHPSQHFPRSSRRARFL